MRANYQMRERISLGSLKQIVTKPRLLARVPKYVRQVKAYRDMELNRLGKQAPLRIYPCLTDAQEVQAGYGFYFYQDCWAARQVFRAKPEFLVDIGSTVLLAGILSQFAPCSYVDIRPLQTHLEGLTAVPGSVLQLPFEDNQIPCLTTMCVLEHIGLGRYGDPLSPTGTLDAVAEISRVIAPGGIVVYSVPVGREMVEFNANRRFRYEQAATFFEGWETVDSCVLAPVPEPYVSEERLLQITDAVACFCMRKPM
jgi:SAM-dependent methyltransferase